MRISSAARSLIPETEANAYTSEQFGGKPKGALKGLQQSAGVRMACQRYKSTTGVHGGYSNQPACVNGRCADVRCRCQGCQEDFSRFIRVDMLARCFKRNTPITPTRHRSATGWRCVTHHRASAYRIYLLLKQPPIHCPGNIPPVRPAVFQRHFYFIGIFEDRLVERSGTPRVPHITLTHGIALSTQEHNVFVSVLASSTTMYPSVVVLPSWLSYISVRSGRRGCLRCSLKL